MNKFTRLSADICRKIFTPNCMAMRYYSEELNVGDALNTYMIPKITGKNIYKPHTHQFQHLLAIGSLLELAGPKSIIWGSGSINGKGPIRPVHANRIHALRGYKSLELMKDICGDCIEVPLGDPGILMPTFYNPNINKSYRLGIIPHHSEKDIFNHLSEILPSEYLPIDVSLGPEAFIDKVKSCEFIISSSLHGLVLADAYEIPNSWVSVSDRIIGGNWKFSDYYSTTCTPEKASHRFETVEMFLNSLETLMQHASISYHTGNKSDLIGSFPKNFLK